jgi:hypothetical protein
MLTAMPTMQKAIAAVDAQPSQYSQPSTTSLSVTSRRLSAPARIVIRCASDQPRSKPLQKTSIRLFGVGPCNVLLGGGTAAERPACNVRKQ